MPYPGFHAARLKDPSKYKKFAYGKDKLGSGIDAVWGIDDEGKTHLQAIRFDKDKFTPNEAKAWLKRKDFSPILFEPASSTMNALEDDNCKLLISEEMKKLI